MRPLTLAAVLLALFAGAALAQAESAEQDVYRAVLSPLIQAGTERLVLGDSALARSIGAAEAAWLQGQAPTISTELLEHFRQQNASRTPLPDLPALPVPIERIGDHELRRLLPGSNPDQWWAEFYRRFPASPGSVRLSRVGFSPDGNHALVYMHHGCGGLCGSGGFLVLRKQDGLWRIQQRIIRISI